MTSYETLSEDHDPECLRTDLDEIKQLMPSKYQSELEQLTVTYKKALGADVSRIKVAIAGASESSIIAVGSGGSFTVASMLCNLHEAYTGRVSRASTPLEIICNPNLASTSPVFLISAEGKNPDIVEGLQRSRLHSARAIHVLTNRRASPLVDCAEQFTNINTHVFELEEKDGYLATNSLLLDAVLVARAYGELDRDPNTLPPSLEELRLGDLVLVDWLPNIATFVTEAVRRGTLLVVFSPLLRPVAADLESKLAEAALLHCQLADLRSFAHGRHLWAAERIDEIAILALIEPTLKEVWDAMFALIPAGIPAITMPFGGAKPRDLITGLVAEMHIVRGIADVLKIDPGQPEVPEFGRKLHYLDLRNLIPAPQQVSHASEISKCEVLGARWPSVQHLSTIMRAGQSFRAVLAQQVFCSIVFDYDGTLSDTHRKEIPPNTDVIKEIRQLIQGGIHVGIASGRGGSIIEHLQESLPESLWKHVQIGLYNCGHMGDLATPVPEAGETSEFLSHVTRIVVRLKELGVPIEAIRTTHPFQVSVRFHEGVLAESNWFVIADALRRAGLDLSSIVRSKHSVDILAKGVSKSHLVAYIVQRFKIEPYQVLTIGDQGAWPGNDASLLEHRFSLSVDIPSRRLDRGWNLAPANKRDVDATLWYLAHINVFRDGAFKIVFDSSDQQNER